MEKPLCWGVVDASMRAGAVAEAELLSQHGGECRLRNPWKGKRITIYKNGKSVRETDEDLIVIDTSEGDVIKLAG